MHPLPFAQINRIKARLTNDALSHLVAVFSQQEGERLLLVYLRDAVPPILPPKCQAIPLGDLRDYDLAQYDGLVMAVSVVDVIRPEIPTKGPNFFSLSHLLRERNCFDLLWHTWGELSCFLLELLRSAAAKPMSEAQKERALFQMIWLAAQARLTQLPRQDLVALVPDRNLAAFVEQGVCRAVYSQLPAADALPDHIQAYSLEQLKHSGFLQKEDRVIAFEEVCSEGMGLGPRSFRFLELRGVLRQSGLDDALDRTLHRLAIDYYDSWCAGSSDAECLRMAHALIVEGLLAKREVDDLIAVLPRDDWDAFAQHGAAIFLYRQLPEHADPGEGTGTRHLSLEDLKSNRLPAGFGQTTFAFLPLAPQFEAAGSARVYDLGLLLHQAGKTGAMARSSWLLARDLLGWSPGERQTRNISIPELAKIATHSCALLGIEDPWLRQGHFRQAVELAYRTQDQILEMQAQASPALEQLYYQALRLWYHCGELKPEEIEPTLNQMVVLLREYEQKSRQLSEPRSWAREQALHLQSVGEALLHMLSGGGQPEIILRVYAEELTPAPSSVPQEIRLVADLAQAIEVPSRLFRLAFRRYAEIVQQIQRIRTSQIPIDDKIARLQDGTVSLRDARRVAFAHRHERRILDRLYEFAIEQTESLVNELQGSAQLEIELLTQAVAQHEEHTLTFLVRNIGRVSAGAVEVEFARSEHFALVEESAVKDLSDLLPEAAKRIPFAIRPRVDHDFAVGLKVTYRDLQQQVRVRQQEFLLRIVSLDRGPFRPKPNPYVYGAPLQDHRLFYGRQRELESLLSHLTAGRQQNVLIRGARRAGKTSVLNMLKAIVDDEQGQGHIRKWFQVPDAWYPALDRLHAIPLDLQSVERQQGALTPSAFYQAILGRIRELGLDSQLLSAMLSEPRVTTTLFTKTLELTLQQHAGTRLVFLLDEFDVVDTITDKTFYAHLRHTISQVQGATWIIASALGLDRAVSDYESPLFNVFKIINLERLDAAAARRLILDPWQAGAGEGADDQVTLQFTDDAVDAILYETGCYPYFIQLLCSAIVEQINLARTNYVQRGMVYQVIDKIIASRSAAYEHFVFPWDRADGIGKVTLLVLLSQIESPNTHELKHLVWERLHDRGISAAPNVLLALYDEGLRQLQAVDAVALDHHNRYVFAIPLFRRLLLERKNHSDLWTNAFQELQADLRRKEKHDG